MPKRMKRHRHILAGSAVALALAAPVPAFAQQQTFQFNIPAQSLDGALRAFARTARQQILFDRNLVRGRQSPALVGSFSREQALERLLAGSGLRYSRSTRGAYILEGVTPRSGEAQAGGAAADSESADQAGTPEILVVGSRSINADIRRTENDAQPYVTFDARDLQQSSARNIEDFLNSRLPMNATRGATSSLVVGGSSESAISLRGLGTNQTLILIDGRRTVDRSTGASFLQSDINGIPLSAIERIEILPSTAGGIYGGNAVGGAINIITRRDYSGVDVTANYGDTTRFDSREYRLEASAGFSLEQGRTRILLTASHSESASLLNGDRDFVARARALQFANNPSAFFSTPAPPVGFTSNIRSVNGSNLVLDNGTPLNSPRTYVPLGYAGPGTDGGAALVANAGQYNLNLPNALINGELVGIYNGPTTDSASIDIRRQFGARIEAFVDFSWSRNEGNAPNATLNPTSITLPANAANNPFTTPIAVTFPAVGLMGYVSHTTGENLRATGGIIARLPGNWTAELDYLWGRARRTSTATGPALAPPALTAALLNGTINVMRDLNASPPDWSPYLLPSPNIIAGPVDSTLSDATLHVSGPLFQLPGGAVTLSGLAEYRRQKVEASFSDAANFTTGVVTTTFNPGRIQDVRSLSAEARIPLVSARNAFPMFRALELQAAIRYDDYETRAPTPLAVPNLASRDAAIPAIAYTTNNFAATSYTLGIRYVPVNGITLRASYGTGFLPPSIDQITPGIPTTITGASAVDPKRGSVSAILPAFTNQGGGNPDLLPEESSSWSAGIVLTPNFLPGLRLSADYTRIRKTNEIIAPTLQVALDLEDVVPGLITRAPLTAADAALGYTGGVITNVKQSLLNFARARVEAYDFQADYTLRTRGIGTLHFYAIATWQPHFQRVATPGASSVEFTGFNLPAVSPIGSLEWRGNGGLTWDYGPWTVGWNAQIYDSYFVYAATANSAVIASAILNQGAARIPSQIYQDVFVTYRFRPSTNGRRSWLAGTEIAFGIQNLFDKEPPIIATTAAVGGFSAYGDPRLRRFTLSLRRHF